MSAHDFYPDYDAARRDAGRESRGVTVTGYVIYRTEDGKYLATYPTPHSYTRRLEQARVFSARDAAVRECCENERVRALDTIFSH